VKPNRKIKVIEKTMITVRKNGLEVILFCSNLLVFLPKSPRVARERAMLEIFR